MRSRLILVFARAYYAALVFTYRAKYRVQSIVLVTRYHCRALIIRALFSLLRLVLQAPKQ